MNVTKISASARTTSGKGQARRLRREGLIPAVAYGKELDTLSLELSPKQLTDVLVSDYGTNSVLELDVDGRALKVLLADYQFHPITRELLHADFVQIHDDREVDVEVPLELTGKSQGVVMGGVLRQVFRRLPVRCLPKDIPVKVTHDITELELEQQVKAGDVSLPTGVAVRLPATQTIAAVVGEKAKDEPEAEAAAEGAAAPGADAPAADAKPAEEEKKA